MSESAFPNDNNYLQTLKCIPGTSTPPDVSLDNDTISPLPGKFNPNCR